MAGMKDTTEELTLDYLLTLDLDFISLYTVAPTDSTEGSEVTGAGYARQSITMARTDQELANTNLITFAESTEEWGTVVAFAINSSGSGTGNQVLWADLATSKTVTTGETLSIGIGEVTYVID